MIRRPPRSTRTDTLFPYTTLFRSTRHFSVSRETLQGSLQRAAILTTDKLKGVRLQLSDNQLKISSSNAEQEEAQEEIDIDYSHEPLDVGFNVSYLLDVLANVKTDTIQWSRSEERRVGKECVSTCRSRWMPDH